MADLTNTGTRAEMALQSHLKCIYRVAILEALDARTICCDEPRVSGHVRERLLSALEEAHEAGDHSEEVLRALGVVKP
jgi:hypothetical protein